MALGGMFNVKHDSVLGYGSFSTSVHAMKRMEAVSHLLPSLVCSNFFRSQVADPACYSHDRALIVRYSGGCGQGLQLQEST